VTWVLDLDGVVWLADQPIAGSAEAVARLQARGERVLLVTNNSSMTLGDYLAKLERHGLKTRPEDLVTSAQVAAGLVDSGSTALVCAGPGVDEALAARGVQTVREGTNVDAVVVGWHRDFDFDRLNAAMQAVRNGARLIGTNDDATYPTPDGVVPGGGSILAAVSYASGVKPEVAGKPYEPMAAYVRALAAETGKIVMLVGDRPSTDGLLAQRIGAPFALVLSGVTHREDLPVEPEPDQIAADLAALVT
jgi:glycerol-1-phosphatase